MIRELKELSEILDTLKQQGYIENYGLIGGMALSIWGSPRTTMDIDMLVLVKAQMKDNFVAELNKYNIVGELKTGDPLEPIPSMIDAEYKGIEIDIICVSKKWELESLRNTITVDIDHKAIPVVDPYYFAILKLKAGSPQDVLDVQNMLKYNDKIDHIKLKEIANTFKVSHKLEQIITKLQQPEAPRRRR
jgi:hypothetical protein